MRKFTDTARWLEKRNPPPPPKREGVGFDKFLEIWEYEKAHISGLTIIDVAAEHDLERLDENSLF